MANRLSGELANMISINQTAFIRKRCIQDNFMCVHQVIGDIYKRKIPTLFMKLDISKAFDTVSWPYLLEVMNHLGFGPRWTNWIAALWCTSSSCYLLNGHLGRRILHCRGVRQGTLCHLCFFFASYGASSQTIQKGPALWPPEPPKQWL
jgi:hypothetical protein